MISEAIIKNYRKSILNQLIFICGSKEMAEDAFQEACISCLTSRNDYTPGGLYMAAKRRLIDSQRKTQRANKYVYADSRFISEKGHELTALDIATNTDLDIEWLEIQEINEIRMERIRELIPYLTETQKKVINLRLLGLRFRQMAEQENININTALGAYKKGLDYLKLVLT